MIAGVRMAAIVAGPLAAASVAVVLPGELAGAGGDVVTIGFATRAVLALAAWMAIWWITEAIPLPVTALLPVTLLPSIGAMPFATAAEAYAHPLIFLFLGGFLVSIAIQKWGLHRRFAVSLLRRVGTHRSRLVGGFMLVTALLSMWLSNTATTIMMLPIALSIVGTSEDDRPFATCLMLGIAYSASIGGMATLIGTPPNLYVASYFSDVLGRDIGFLTWMAVGVPCSAALLPLAWVYLTRVRYRLSGSGLPDPAVLAGPGLVWTDLGRGERASLVLFLVLVCAWVGRPFVGDVEVAGFAPFADLTDAGIALIVACLLFVVPVDLAARRFVLDWPDASDLPWGTLLLFGGGLSLAAAISATGADQVIALWVSRLPGLEAWLLGIAIVALVILLTELTSNIATTATLVPVLAASAPFLGLDREVVIVTVALAASCAFMLPVATPPNAIVFGSGRVAATEMARVGMVMNVIALVVISIVGYGLVPRVFA